MTIQRRFTSCVSAVTGSVSWADAGEASNRSNPAASPVPIRTRFIKLALPERRWDAVRSPGDVAGRNLTSV